MTIEDPSPDPTEVANKPDRRAAVLALVAALAAGTALAPKEGRAQLFGGGGDLGFDVDDPGELIDALLRAFAEIADVPVPGFVRDMLDFLQGLLGSAGDDSFSGEDPVGAIERSFPSDPETVATPNARRVLLERKVTATRLRADEALAQASNVSVNQAAITTDEVAIATAAAASQNLLHLMAANNALVASMSARVGGLAHQLQALTTLLADPHLQVAFGPRLEDWAAAQLLPDRGEELAPPAELPGVR